MRKEIENWWRQAEKDPEKAQWLCAGKHFDGIVRTAAREGIEL